jgi:hypothetical protein
LEATITRNAWIKDAALLEVIVDPTRRRIPHSSAGLSYDQMTTGDFMPTRQLINASIDSLSMF